MSLCFRQERMLRRTEDALRRSDPHLATMFAIFGRLGADEPMPAGERVHTRLGWLRRPLARAAAHAGGLAARAGHLGAVMLLRSAAAWVAVSALLCQVPFWPGSTQVRRYGAGHGSTERAGREAGAG